MNRDDLLKSLERLKVETGSLACLGCGREHDCSTKGCAILRAAVQEIKTLASANKRLGDQLHAAQLDLARLDACQVCGWWDGSRCQAPKDVRMGGSCFAWRGAERTRLWED